MITISQYSYCMIIYILLLKCLTEELKTEKRNPDCRLKALGASVNSCSHCCPRLLRLLTCFGQRVATTLSLLILVATLDKELPPPSGVIKWCHGPGFSRQLLHALVLAENERRMQLFVTHLAQLYWLYNLHFLQYSWSINTPTPFLFGANPNRTQLMLATA